MNLMEINYLKNKVENGSQLGSRFSFERNGYVYWSSVGLQKWVDAYKVYVDEIKEKNMAAEEYEREETNSFLSLDDALLFIELNTQCKLSDLIPCKGQKIFNPRFE